MFHFFTYAIILIGINLAKIGNDSCLVASNCPTHHLGIRDGCPSMIFFRYSCLLTFVGLWAIDFVTTRCQAAEPLYDVVDLGTTPRGWGTEPKAINNKGEGAGIGREWGGASFIFLYREGKLIRIAGGLGEANALNDRGEVMGSLRIGSDKHAMLWRPMQGDTFRAIDVGWGSVASMNATGHAIGSFVDHSIWIPGQGDRGTSRWVEVKGLKTQEPATTQLIAINDRCQIIGAVLQPILCAGGTRGFRWQEGVAIDLGTLGGEGCVPTALNASGQVVGYSGLNDPDPKGVAGTCSSHAFLWDESRIRDLGTIRSGRISAALGVNASGQVVGWASTRADDRTAVDRVAFVFRNEIMQDLNQLIPSDSGWNLSEARGINDRGQVIGLGRRNGTNCGFLLTPRDRLP